MSTFKENPDLDSLASIHSGDTATAASDAPSPDPADQELTEEESTETTEDEQQPQVEQQPEKKKPEYDPARVRDFLIRLAKAVTRHELRKQAHTDFHKQVDKIKDSMLSKRQKSQPAVENELEALKQKVSHLINVERDPNHPENNKFLKEKIALLEGKLNILMKSKDERENRFKELESKINSKYDTERELVRQLETKLLILEKKLVEHQLTKKKAKQKVNNKAIDEIKQQIETTKAVIKKFKK